MSLLPITDNFLSAIILQTRAYTPSLAGRVGGAAHFEILPEDQNMAVPCAWVMPAGCKAERMTQNATRVSITDNFSVVVALSNKPDERGQTASTSLYGIRRELFRALAGYQPDKSEYQGITFDGDEVIHVDRSRLWVRFDFSTEHEYALADSWQGVFQAGIPGDSVVVGLGVTGPNALSKIHLNVDEITPAANPLPGPDGRIEFQADITPP